MRFSAVRPSGVLGWYLELLNYSCRSHMLFSCGNSVDTSALFSLENPNLYFYLTVAVVRKFCQHKDLACWDLLLAK